MDALPAESQGKPKNTGVGSLFLLQGIFSTQELKSRSPALQADSLPTELLLPIAMTPESVFYSHIWASVIAKDHPT